MLELTERASRDAPLDEVLSELVERIAGLLEVQVCSIYLRDDLLDGEADELVLRATFGFAQEAVGTVRMRVGEGLTGFAVECLRPVSVATAVVDTRNKRFEGLGEERFPALCALPLVDGGRGIGALVVQRSEAHAFEQREVVLIAAMAPAVLFALERARSRKRDAEAQVGQPRNQRRPMEVLLRGVPAAKGRAIGVVAVQRARLTAPSGRGSDRAAEAAALTRAFADVATDVSELDAWARDRFAELSAASPTPSPTLQIARARLLALRFVAEDGRLKERALDHVESGASAAAAVERVAREYARVLGDAADETLRERAVELETLSDRILQRLATSTDIPHVEAPLAGRIHAASRLTVFEAVELGRGHCAGCALSGPASASPGVDVARALGIPVACDVRALFRWAQDGDRALVDGDAGTVLLNPSRADVAALRRDRVPK